MTRYPNKRMIVYGPPDDPRQQLIDLCRAETWEVSPVTTRKDLTTQLEARDIRCVLLAIGPNQGDGLEILADLHVEHPEVVVVAYATARAVRPVVEAMTSGAFDVLEAPFRGKEIRALLKRVEALEGVSPEAVGEYEMHVEQARRGIRFQRLDLARDHVTRAVDIDPGRPEAYNLRGILDEIDGNLADAQNSYRQALDADPAYQPAIRNLEQSVEPGHKGSFLLGEVKVDRFRRNRNDQ